MLKGIVTPQNYFPCSMKQVQKRLTITFKQKYSVPFARYGSRAIDRLCKQIGDGQLPATAGRETWVINSLVITPQLINRCTHILVVYLLVVGYSFNLSRLAIN